MTTRPWSVSGRSSRKAWKRCTKNWAKVVERMGKLRQSCPRVSAYYHVEVIPAAAPVPAMAQAQALRWERTAQQAASDLRAVLFVTFIR